MHQCGMFLPLSPLCISVFIVCQTQCSTPVHHVCISVTSRFFQVFHTPLFWRSGIAARFCCPASNPTVPSCLYLFIRVVTSFAINTNFAVWILGMHFYWDRGSSRFYHSVCTVIKGLREFCLISFFFPALFGWWQEEEEVSVAAEWLRDSVAS